MKGPHYGLMFALAAAVAWSSAPSGARAEGSANVDVPASLTLVARVQAGGAQIYRCTAGADGSYAWTLVGPKALLFNDDGSDFGTHGAGPHWTAADGSTIVADGTYPLSRVARDGAVPSLLLRVATPAASGTLAGVTTVARTDTVGGLAPTAGCDAQHANAMAASRYTALYGFYR